jgi:UDP-N-acetylglucosamine 2-epimerase
VFPAIDPKRRLILVTGHRRENFDGGLERVCVALRKLAERGDVQIIYPVHLNPRVRSVAQTVLANHPAIHSSNPWTICPSLQPCAALSDRHRQRRHSGRSTRAGQAGAGDAGHHGAPEAIDAGTARLVGTATESLLDSANELLDDAAAYRRMAQAKNPFGDARPRNALSRACWGSEKPYPLLRPAPSLN